jgi:hypothetical protein
LPTRSVTRIAILSTIVAALLLSGHRRTYAQGDSPELKLDPALLIEAHTIWEVIGRDDNPLWPGWNATDTPIMIYLPGVQELLINHPTPPDGFDDYRGVFADCFGSVKIKSGDTLIKWDGQNTSREIYGRETLVLADTLSNRKNWLRGWVANQAETREKLQNLSYSSLRADPYEQLAMIAHEAFHVFQMRELNHKTADERDVRVYPCLSVENNVGVALESIFLAEATRATDPKDIREQAIRWLAVRLDRRRKIPESSIHYEDANEFIEGSAKYVEVACMKYLQGTQPPEQLRYFQGFNGFDDLDWFVQYRIKQMLDNMQGKVNVNNDPYGTSPVRGRLYFSGMGIALLLDKIDPEWKNKIRERDVSLTQLVERTLMPTPQQLQAGLQEARKHPELKSLYEAKRKLAQDGKEDTQRMLDGILHGPHTLAEIDWAKLESDKLALSFTAFGVRAIDQDRTIYTLVPISAQLSSAKYRFKQSVPTETLEDRQHRIFRFQLPGKVEMEWLTRRLGAPDGNSWLVDDLDLEFKGTHIQARRACVSFENSSLKFRFLPASSTR